MVEPFEEAWTFLKRDYHIEKFAPLAALAGVAARGLAGGAAKVATRGGAMGSNLLQAKEKVDAVAENPMVENAQKVKQKLDENSQKNAQQNMQMQNDMREAAKTNARTGSTTSN
tara:strand:- start:1244 stop:1585 length:342 start_codon:yes stop_codon:yes gene_type:complete